MGRSVSVQRPVVGRSLAVAAFLAAAVVGACGIAAANIVGACGIICGNGRGWLLRSCGKTSSKPAANIVDQQLTNVRGQASLLFYGFQLQRVCAPCFDQLDRHWREQRLLRAAIFPSSSRCFWLRADSLPAKGGVSVIPKKSLFALSGRAHLNLTFHGILEHFLFR